MRLMEHSSHKKRKGALEVPGKIEPLLQHHPLTNPDHSVQVAAATFKEADSDFSKPRQPAPLWRFLDALMRTECSNKVLCCHA